MTASFRDCELLLISMKRVLVKQHSNSPVCGHGICCDSAAGHIAAVGRIVIGVGGGALRASSSNNFLFTDYSELSLPRKECNYLLQ